MGAERYNGGGGEITSRQRLLKPQTTIKQSIVYCVYKEMLSYSNAGLHVISDSLIIFLKFL